MTTGKFNTINSLTIFIGTGFSLVAFIICICSYFFNPFIFSSQADLFFVGIVSFIGLIIFLLSIELQLKIVKIDGNDKIIIFKSIISRKASIYHFSEFDGYYDMILRYGNGSITSPYPAIGLSKKGLIILLIRGWLYSNIDELRDELSTIKFLGEYTQKKYLSLWERITKNN